MFEENSLFQTQFNRNFSFPLGRDFAFSPPSPFPFGAEKNAFTTQLN
jgi:hypothetical protein